MISDLVFQRWFVPDGRRHRCAHALLFSFRRCSLRSSRFIFDVSDIVESSVSSSSRSRISFSLLSNAFRRLKFFPARSIFSSQCCCNGALSCTTLGPRFPCFTVAEGILSILSVIFRLNVFLPATWLRRFWPPSISYLPITVICCRRARAGSAGPKRPIGLRLDAPALRGRCMDQVVFR